MQEDATSKCRNEIELEQLRADARDAAEDVVYERRAARLLVIANAGGALLAGVLSVLLALTTQFDIVSQHSIPASKMSEVRAGLADLVGSVIVSGMLIAVALSLAAFLQPSRWRALAFGVAGVVISVVAAVLLHQSLLDLGVVAALFGGAVIGDVVYLAQRAQTDP